MKILFSHGKESGPWGRKIKILAKEATQLGFEVDSIDYTFTLDPEERVQALSNYLVKQSYPCILVGSSMGGYVSTVNALRHNVKVKGLFLLAPALFMRAYKVQEYNVTCPTFIVHGWQDDVIPVESSLRLSKQLACQLYLVNDDHSLTYSLPSFIPNFRRFLVELKNETISKDE